MGNAALLPTQSAVLETVMGGCADMVDEAEARLINTPQVECPLRHDFAPGLYLRTVKMAAGLYIIGHRHKTEHPNVVLTGRALVSINGEVEEIVAPCVFISKPGVRKVLLIQEEMEWMTVHATRETDLDKLAEELIIKSEAFLEHEKEVKALQEAHDKL